MNLRLKFVHHQTLLLAFLTFFLSVFCFVDFVLFSLSLCQVREQQSRGSLVWSIVLGKREENYDDERYGEEKREVGRVERKC